MRLTSLTTAVVEANFDWTIVRAEADDGSLGYGEAFFAPGLPQIVEALAPLVVGRDPRAVLPLVDRLYRATSGAGSGAGIVLNAISGIDAALWDLSARALGAPLWQMLGGTYRDRVRLYADCHAGSALMSLGPVLELRQPSWAPDAGVDGDEPLVSLFDAGAESEPLDLDAVRASARDAVERGFDAVKFDVDVPGLAPERDADRRLPPGGERRLVELLAAIVEGLDGRAELALDCHWRYDLASARRIAAACEGADLMWLEDPLAPDNLSGLAQLARTTKVPLATGENLGRWPAFASLIEDGCVAVVTPDLAKVGGLAEARAIAHHATARGLAIGLHNIAGPIGTAFAAQVAATFPNFLALEFHALSVPFFDDLVGGDPLIEQGHVVLRDRPGIGVQVDEAAVARHAKRGELVFGRAVA